jgi:hypothetical protein
MADTELARYLDAAAALHGLNLSADQRAAALLQLGRLSELAATFVDLPLAASEEPILGLCVPGDAP